MAASPAYAAAMTTDRLIAFAEERGIPIDTEEVSGVRQFVFIADPQHRWRILKLLDDDYLHSSLTDHRLRGQLEESAVASALSIDVTCRLVPLRRTLRPVRPLR